MSRNIVSNIDEQIQDRVENIKEAIPFADEYGRLPCFRAKVNNLYNQSILNDPDYASKKIKPRTLTDLTRVYPARIFLYVWRTGLSEAQELLAQCLREQEAQRQQQGGQSGSASATEFLDPPVGDSGPFDRRLDRLLITDESSGPFPIIPYNTQYQDAATIGFTLSEDVVRNSQIENQDDVAASIAAKRAEMASDPFFQGVPAIANSYAMTRLYGSNSGEYLVDKKDERRWYEIDTTNEGRLAYSLNPTTTSIINWGEGDPYGRTPYHFSDFVFCKYWNIVPNNRMITLRRFAAPVLDNLKFPGMDGNTAPGSPTDKSDSGFNKDAVGNVTNVNTDGDVNFEGEAGTPVPGSEDQGSGKKVDFPPMATAVTYFGEETGNQLSDILKFTTGFNWGEVESDVFTVDTASTPDMESGPGGLFGGLGSMARMLNVATGNFNNEAILNEGLLPPDPYSDGPYENRIIGPVNAITKVRKRERGLQFENKISLTFDYVARPIGGVNTKAVLLDIISNFLVIGSATAMFWGGQHRFMGQPQRYPFIGGDKGIQQWYRGDPLGWGQSSIESFTQKTVTLGAMAKEFFSNLLGGAGGKGGIMGNVENIMKGDNVASNIIRHEAAVRSNGQIPYLTGLRALLIGEPVGEWHITIGNPLNPIAMIGNLICDNIEVEFGNELGPDDFPLEAKITVNLEHGMPRDRDAIQSMFNRGMGRIYELPDSMAGSADFETKVDRVTGNRSKTGRSPADWRSGNVFATSATTGGTTGKSQNVDNALHSANSVWNREKFSAVSPNQTAAFTPGNIMTRSEFRAGEWISKKTLN